MRVLVTGHRGYIGSVLTCLLRHAHFDVVGLDCELFTGCDFGHTDDDVPAFVEDFRDIEYTDLLSFDAVVHLAGVELGRPGERVAEEGYAESVVKFAAKCRQADVSRFMLASSYELYAGGCFPEVEEEDPIRPVTQAGRVGLRCERGVLSLATDSFSPVVMRLGSVYGVSPRLRLDLPLNNLVASAVACGHVRVQSTGQERFPLIHVEDVARACVALLLAPQISVHGEVFNVVREGEDYRMIDLADAVTELSHFCRRELRDETLVNQRVRVRGEKLYAACPDVRMCWTMGEGIQQLAQAMVANGMTPAEWRSDRYRRGLRLDALLAAGRVDRSFRLKEPRIRQRVRQVTAGAKSIVASASMCGNSEFVAQGLSV